VGTNFWQIASLFLSVVQLGLYISAVRKYKGRLEDLADGLCVLADTEAMKYMEFRDCDPDFYDYYKSLPDYEECQSAIKRNKGASFFKYGSNIRRRQHSNRGYTPLTMVHWNQYHGQDAVYEAAVSRALTCIKERERRNDHILERWSAIVSAPVGVERYSPGTINPIINAQFSSLKQFGRGFNSAGAAFGTSLFQVLN
jgi:hypothetical protein